MKPGLRPGRERRGPVLTRINSHARRAADMSVAQIKPTNYTAVSRAVAPGAGRRRAIMAAREAARGARAAEAPRGAPAAGAEAGAGRPGGAAEARTASGGRKAGAPGGGAGAGARPAA